MITHSVNIILRKIRTLCNILKFNIIQKKHKTKNGNIKYLYYNKSKSDSLLICFAAFPPRVMPVYNNVKTFKKIAIDKLFIKDDFGYRGSYYMYENGTLSPYYLTRDLIDYIISKGGYKHIYTAGSSKGGSCAIFYGLVYGAEHIFSGACQFNIGTYLSAQCHLAILKAMMNSASIENVRKLNMLLPECIEKHKNSSSVVHLIYSDKEETYQYHTKDLIQYLDKNKIKHVDTVFDFTDHNQIALYFGPYVVNYLTNNRA